MSNLLPRKCLLNQSLKFLLIFKPAFPCVKIYSKAINKKSEKMQLLE